MRTNGTEKTQLTEMRSEDMMIVGDWIYYIGIYDYNPYESYIYKMRLDGSEVSRFNDNYDEPSGYSTPRTVIRQTAKHGIQNFLVDADNEWIYYTTQHNYIYKIRTDFTEKSRVVKVKQKSFISSPLQTLNKSGDWLYYRDKSTISQPGSMYRINSRGKTHEIDGGTYIIGEWIYYYVYNELGMSLYRMKLDGTEHELIG
jgi:hypothetical protein